MPFASSAGTHEGAKSFLIAYQPACVHQSGTLEEGMHTATQTNTNHIEQQALIKKDNSQNINKTLVYLSICISLAIAGYYFLA